MFGVLIVSKKDAKAIHNFLRKLDRFLSAIVKGNPETIAKQKKQMATMLAIYLHANRDLGTACALYLFDRVRATLSDMVKDAKQHAETRKSKLN